MLRGLITACCLIMGCLNCSCVYANAEDDYYTGEKVYGSRPKVKSERKMGHIGPTGIMARIAPGVIVTVEGVEAGTPAEGQFEKGDIILGVNGTTLKERNPFVILGQAITKAEAKDGRLIFDYTRQGQAHKATLAIPVMGSYSKTWPLNCAKSKKIIEHAAAVYADKQILNQIDYLGGLDTLFLLSTGDDKYLPLIKERFAFFIKNPAGIGENTWYNGYNGIACAEYYLRTGDKSILPVLQYYCDDARRRQRFGCSWTHGGSGINPGYVAGGLMNPAGAQILTTLLLAKECGVKVDEATLLGSLKFFYRFVGHGQVAYGDHRGEGSIGSNGKNGMIAAAMQVACGAQGTPHIYVQARNSLSLAELMGYQNLVEGHGDHGRGDAIWRGISAVYLAEQRPRDYRAMRNRLTWFYDLSRDANGGMGIATHSTDTDVRSGVAIALAYTAPLKTLRITGAPRSRYAKEFTLPTYLWGNPADMAFFGLDHNPTYYKYGKDEPTHLAVNLLGSAYTKGPPPKTIPRAQLLKNVYHRSYVIRCQAAKALRQVGALKELEQLLSDKDPRVRRAALDGINDYRYWFLAGKKPLKTADYTPGMITAILKMLHDPEEAWYVMDGVLFAMRNMPAKVIQEQIKYILPWTRHEEWWLRETAFFALSGLEKDKVLYPKILPTLLTMLKNEYHTQPRQRMLHYLKSKINQKNSDDVITRRIIAGLQTAAEESEVRDGPRMYEGGYNVWESAKVCLEADPSMVVPMACALAKRVNPGLADKFVGWVRGRKGLYTALDELPPRQRKILEGLLVTEFRGPLARKLIEWKAVNNGQDDKRLSDTIAELRKLAKSQTTDADTDAPKPDPATFASPPAALSFPEIVMTATKGNDSFGPVEYFFDETSGNPGGTDSGWTTRPVYRDTALKPGTRYTYTVKTRDAFLQAGTASAPVGITTPLVATKSISVPNYGFEMFYKPGQTTITATLSGYTQGVGFACPIESGKYNFSDKTTGTVADIPGWIGYDRDGWTKFGATGERDRTNGNLQGLVSGGGRASRNCYKVNGCAWHNPAGGLIVSEAPLGKIRNKVTYVLSLYARGSANPVVLNLLVDGVVVTPTSSTDPAPGGWQEFTRTYVAGDLRKYVGKSIKIVCGVGRDAKSSQTAFDNVSLIYYQHKCPVSAN